MIAAIIPARGGSKGVPNKNLLDIGGESLIRRAVRCCEESPMIDAVYVSTDSPEIAASSKCPNIIERPAELATDEALSSDVLLHAVAEIEASGEAIDVLAFVQCTAPLITPQDITLTLAGLLKHDTQVCVAVAPTDAMQVTVDVDGRAHGVGFDLRNPKTRRQERQQAYEICGSVWAMLCGPFVQRRTIYCDSISVYKCNRRLEIDSMEDVKLARLLLSDLTSQDVME